MMEGRVPVVDRVVVPAAGQLELVVEVVAQDQALDLDIVLVGTGRRADLPEEGQPLGQPGRDVARQLTQDEPLVDRALCLYVIDVREAEYRRGGHGGGLVADEALSEDGRAGQEPECESGTNGNQITASAQSFSSRGERESMKLRPADGLDQ